MAARGLSNVLHNHKVRGGAELGGSAVGPQVCVLKVLATLPYGGSRCARGKSSGRWECLNMEIVTVSLKLHCRKHVGAYYYQPRIGLSVICVMYALCILCILINLQMYSEMIPIGVTHFREQETKAQKD